MAIPSTTKYWTGGNSGNTGDWEEPMNWEGDSLVNASYAWTASAGGEDEYYLRTSAPADPSVSDPSSGAGTISEGDAEMTNGTIASLAAGEWDYGDGDSLGYSTIYVRLTSGSADPDDRIVHYVKSHYIPVASDTVIVPARSDNAIDANLDQSALSLAAFDVEEGFTKNIGTDTASLELNTGGNFSYHGTGALAKFDFGVNLTNVVIFNTGAPSVGESACQLHGTGMSTITVFNGDVAIGFDRNSTDETNSVEIYQIDVTKQPTCVRLGVNVTDLDGSGDPDIIMEDGKCFAKCDVDVCQILGGEYWQVLGKWAAGTFKDCMVHIQDALTGRTFAASTVHPGGAVRNETSYVAHTFTNVTVHAGGEWTDKNLGTYTNPISTPDGIGNNGANLSFGPATTIAPA